MGKGQDILSIIELTKIGSKRIDEEHLEILQLLEAIIGGLDDPAGTGALADRLGELEALWEKHTVTERQVFMEHGYPFHDHFEIHDAIADKIRSLRQRAAGSEDAGRLQRDVLAIVLDFYGHESLGDVDFRNWLVFKDME